MAVITFATSEAYDHFKKVCKQSLDDNSYFGERGLHAMIEYLRTYGDEGKGRVYNGPEDTVEWRVLFGYAYEQEISLSMQTRRYVQGKSKTIDESWDDWKQLWVGGLVWHNGATWGVHT